MRGIAGVAVAFITGATLSPAVQAQSEAPAAAAAPGETVPPEGPAGSAAASQAADAAAQPSEPAQAGPQSTTPSEPNPELRAATKQPHDVEVAKNDSDAAESAGDGPEKKKDRETLRAKGRLLVLSELARRSSLVVNPLGVPENRTTTSLDLAVQSARVGLEYRSPLGWLSAQIELELAGRLELKDAYAEAEQEHWNVRAGQFKVPISALEMESIWTLPVAHRGFVHDILVNRLDIAGRRPGVAATVRGRGGIKPRLTLGVFQGSALVLQTTDDRDTALIAQQGMASQSAVARAQVKLSDLKLGAGYEHRVGAPSLGRTRHYWTAGADLEWSYEHSEGGLRAWGDFLSGASWYEHPDKPSADGDAVFMTLRALCAYRFGGVKKEQLYFEPFLFVAAHDPDTDVKVDQAREGMLGVAVGFWERARLTLQGEAVKVRRNFPATYSVGSDPDRVALMLRAGVSL